MNITLPRAVAQRAIDVLYELEAALAQPPVKDSLTTEAQPQAEPAKWWEPGFNSTLAFTDEAQPATQQEPAKNWRHVIPGGRRTDPWESARIGDFNEGWNAYRKAVKEVLEKIDTTPQPTAPAGEPVAVVVDPYDTPGLQWLCQHPPMRGAVLFTTPQPRKLVALPKEAPVVDSGFSKGWNECIAEVKRINGIGGQA